MQLVLNNNENMMHTKTAHIFCKTVQKILCKINKLFCLAKKWFCVSILELDFIFSWETDWIWWFWRQTPSSIWHEIAMIYRAWIMSRIAEIIIIWTAVEASWTLFHLGFYFCCLWWGSKSNSFTRQILASRPPKLYNSQCLKIAGKVSFKIASEANYIWMDKSLLKRPKIGNFDEFLKIRCLLSNSVTRQVIFNWTKIGRKCQNW